MPPAWSSSTWRVRPSRWRGATRPRLGLTGVRVVQAPVLRYLAGPATPAALALLDPPYALGESDLAAVLAALDAGHLAPGALVVVERDARSPEPLWPADWAPDGVRRYGDTALWTATARLRA